MIRGQVPKPAVVKNREGNRRQRGRAQIKEDPQGIGPPGMPDRLTEVQKGLWRKVVGSLPVGLLSRADDAALEQFAIEWAAFREADEKIKLTGLLVQSPQGPVRNPLLVVRNQAGKAMMNLGMLLGLSPVARARLAAPASSDNDPMALLLGDDGNPDGAWSTAPKTRQ
jgi:P27 family predicted phage terminase small subunit